MRKKFIKCMTAAAMTVVGVMAAVFPVLADSPIKSSGNLIYEEEAVSLCAADFDYLYTETDNLQQEQELTALPDISEEGVGRKDALASRGIINYADGTVVMDSSDLVRLADWIDGLDAAYEDSTADMAEALKEIGTYFTADGSITHEPEKAGSFGGNAGKLPYHKISEGILQSQSVTHLAEQKIRGAIAGNLSRGTAAWVDGELIVGSGADNDACYDSGYSAGEEKGYKNGYAMGAKDAESNVNPSSASYREGYNTGYAVGAKDAESNVNPSSASYREGYNTGYAQGKAASAPVILTGTISGFGDAVTDLRSSVQIPAGLTYVCAGISVTGCIVYSYPAVDMWSVDTSWNYDAGTGLVSFKLGMGGKKYLASDPVIHYTIMYVP